jgi:hypothetical protein
MHNISSTNYQQHFLVSMSGSASIINSDAASQVLSQMDEELSVPNSATNDEDSQVDHSAPNSIEINNDNSQFSTASSTSLRTRRLSEIKSVTSSQRFCFICKNVNGRRRIPKKALAQVWNEKTIFIPHCNRVCQQHLEGKLFSEDAMDEIVSTKDGVLLSDEEISTWIFELTLSHQPEKRQRRYNFDDPNNVTSDDYATLVGFSKEDFDSLLPYISGQIHNSVNRSARNALAIFMMTLRHDFTQVIIYKKCCK